MDPSQQAKILLVDDEENILRALQRFLIPSGHDVSTALSGKEALALLEQAEFDIIISDMKMPEMNGAAFLKLAAEKYPDTRRILLTGFAEIDSAVSAINEGKIDFYLSKPWNEEQLNSAIASTLEIRQLKEKNKSLMIRLAKANRKLTGKNEALEEEVGSKSQDIETLYKQTVEIHHSTIDVLTNLIEMLEGNNKGLSRQVSMIATEIARRMNMSEEEIEVISLAGLLYGIGKIGLKESLIYKPYEYFTHEQQEEFSQYPTLGELTLSSYKGLDDVANLIASHREYVDGSGFPNRKKGAAIPMGARIICCSLDFCLLRKGLLLAKEHTADQTKKYIKMKDKLLYDSRVVSLICDVVDELDLTYVSENEKSIPSTELQVGMVLSRDLLTSSNMMLLPKGQALTREQVDKMKQVNAIPAYVQIG